ncbi:hypothetical protein [Roseovarius sp.]|uniref:hypothetical protein n=1 Tax=Roseovarius sp. TaxID=1486281 RepID=UPI003A970F1B
MSDYETYRAEFDKEQAYYDNLVADTQNKAFDYGILVVKNAILVAGGGLLAIPAIVGLSKDVPIDRAQAAVAGIYFVSALLIAIFATYIIHLNWTLHSAAWEKHWENRAEVLRKLHIENVSPKELELGRQEPFKKRIAVSFYLPHFMAVIYLILIGLGFLKLYSALGVSA